MKQLKTELELEFKKRKSKNSSYSLRSFAQSLGVNSGTLSQIFSNKRALSLENQNKIWARLGKAPVSENSSKSIQIDLETDTFQLISDWSHFAVLELFELGDFQPNTKWMGQKLGLSPFEVNLILERLHRVQLIEPKNKFYIVTKKNLSTLGMSHTNIALQNLQKQILSQAIEAIDTVPPERRDQSTLTIAIPKKALPEIKKRVTEFRREMNSWLTEMKSKDDVYQLTISLFPANPKGSGASK